LSHRSGRRVVVALLVAGLLAALVGLVPSPSPTSAAPTPFTAHGSVEQVWAVDLDPGVAVDLLDASDAVVASATADEQGSILFREVAVGSGYRVRQEGELSSAVTVVGPQEHPDQSFYDGISIAEGYGYVPTRDGTTLSINVNFPIGGGPGPWPVVIDYSGYDPSAPGGPPQEALPFQVQGYVVVGVNMRGTGCSGGAFDFFEMLQSLDGYDVVEAVAAQPWSNGDVGLVGISYPGISQLFVAQTQPPHLRAITPLSVIADTYRSTLYPGGILNSGFALGWASDRVDGSKPAAHQWTRDRIAGGDTVCEQNQKLKLQARDLLAEIRPDRFYEAAGDAIAPRTFVDKIDVPVYLAGQFQDEQTGGHFSTMVPNFTSAPVLRVTLTNGTHVEPLGPEQMQRLLEFVDFYVGKRKPQVSPILRAAIGSVYEGLFGFSGATLPADRFDAYPDYASALAAYQAEPPVRVLWENGGGLAPGEPYATAESEYASWPVPGTIAQSWYLQPDGQLSPVAPEIADDEPRGMSSYVFDPTTKRKSTYDGSTDSIWRVNPDLHWEPLEEGNSLSFVTDPFTTQTAMAGWGSVDLWLRSQAADTDLEVTLTEVRPDGQERYIQSGWLRASHRKLDPSVSTELGPFQTHLEADAEDLPAGQFVSARVALFPFAHVLRAGSRLRVNIEAPGGNQPFWQFDTITPYGVRNDIAHSVGRPSKVVLPVLPAAQAPAVPALAPPCPSLRNQPCRDYLPARVPTDVTLAQDGTSRFDVTWTAPERGGAPDHYQVVVGPAPQSTADLAAFAADAPSVSTAQVAGDVTSYGFDAQPDVAYVATVQAVYEDGGAPVSNASLEATLADESPTSTSTTAPTVPSSGGDEPSTEVASGDLPTTGADLAGPLLVAALLLGGGVAFVVISRRRRTP
jgi:predicted acyl esterase